MNGSNSSYTDWNPQRVDVLTLARYGDFAGIPLCQLQCDAAFNGHFPDHHRDGQGERLFRLCDLDIFYFSGA
jgi:hypothetical protein